MDYTGLTEIQAKIIELELKGKKAEQIARYMGLSIAEIKAQRNKGVKGVQESGVSLNALVSETKKHATFRRIVAKAMLSEGMYDLDEQCEFLAHAVGDDYKNLAYQLWPPRS